MKILTFLIVICSLIGALYSIYHVIVSVGGWLHKKREIPSHPAQKRFAVLIPARNEETVLPYLIESVLKQDYPKELFEIIAIPNNCSDDTAGAAERAGARVFTIDKPVQNKADVLEIVFHALDREPFDAYVVLDADNVIDKSFLKEANNALCEGFEAAQAHRESKNLNRSWLSFCSGTSFYFTNALYNRSRFRLGLSAALNGTGVVVSRDLIRKTSFSMRSLTEDQEYSIHCVLHGVSIAYLENAVTYDEQPVDFKSAVTQRRRWGYGVYQCFKWYSIPLLKKALKERSLICLDYFLWCFCVITISAGVLSCLCTLIMLLIGAVSQGVYLPTLLFLAGSIVSMVLSGVLSVLVIFAASGIPLRKTFPYLFTMGFFLVICAALYILPIVTKPPKWLQIPHNEKMTIDEMTKV